MLSDDCVEIKCHEAKITCMVKYGPLMYNINVKKLLKNIA